MGICFMINTITGFLQRLLFINRKVLLAEENGEESRIQINAYGLVPNERIALAATIFGEIFIQDTNLLKLSEKAKVDIVVTIIKDICKHTNTNINITINERKK